MAANDVFNLKALFIEEELEFLIRNNGEQVNIKDLDGKIVALYFSMSYTMGKLKWFDQELVELYTKLASKGENFEVVYIGDHGYGDEKFKACFSKMPWLAIPPLELEIQDHLRDMFRPLPWHPVLAILDGRGLILNFNGYEAFKDYDSDAYPFTPEKHTELKLKEDEQPLQFLLGSETRDFLIAYNGTEVPLSELEGKNVGVFFVPECDEGGCEEFIHSMKTKLEKIKEGGEEFELVIVPIEAAYNEEKMNKMNFQHVFKDLACLSIPLSDKRCCKRLVRRFYSPHYPDNLMIIGADRRRYEVHLTCEGNQEFASEILFDGKMEECANIKSKSLESLLSSADRDYVIGKGDVKVRISDLEGRTVIFYFAPKAADSVRCNTCTKFLVEAYHELRSKGEDLEVVFVSFHKDEHEFNQHFSKMPWLALPFSDTESHNKLRDRFPHETFGGLPHLLVRDVSGDIICKQAFWYLLDYGSKAYPFTNEKIDQVKKDDEILKKKPQNLHKLLGSDTRDFLISSNGDKVPISELEGKIVALDFRHLGYPTPTNMETYQILKDMYFKLREKGEKFELVSIFYNEDMPSPSEAFQGMPWLAVPLNDQETSERLFRYFHVFEYRKLIVVDALGMILNNCFLPNFLRVVYDLGDKGYPFTPEKIQKALGDETHPFTFENYNKASAKLKERRMMTPKSVFISWQRDYLLGKDGIKFPASQLMGKTILLLWTVEIGEFECKLIEIYGKIKEKNSAFEVIFILNEELFTEMFSAMPWLLAIGSRDLRTFSVCEYFKLVPISELEGKIVALDFRHLGYLAPTNMETHQVLKDMYFKLREKGEKFKLVSIFYNEDMPSPFEAFQGMPWLAVPLNDQETRDDFEQLCFTNFLHVVYDLGDEGYPFTPEKIQKILGDETHPFSFENYDKASAKLKERRMMTPESVLVSWQRDYLLGKDGIKFPASGLMDKTILLLWTVGIGEFERKLIEIHGKIKEKNSAFEVIFILNEELFTEMFPAMPWLLAIGSRDLRTFSVCEYFKLVFGEDNIYPLVAIHRLGSGHSFTRGWRLRSSLWIMVLMPTHLPSKDLRELEGSST
ncbi:hypothetical protein J5N97_002144 [Dioscorea zingiberensis]|uniref:protein-disulfide reductase n=1 Tax=Dioscorea zingiberensis TaxID=325984 RepID=A0A9D5D299_9LILI|nr:hypothetical protein J5N97_002144 [Dioscorea zingiberensis]